MKRSDMLKLIENSIDEYDMEKHNCLSDLILCNIEEAGMMPPKGKMAVTIGGIETFITDHCWEK